jgi:PAS domain S-box-containing protein
MAREMLAEARQEKFILEWASSYAEGRAILQNNPYDAVLVDYDLGAYSGINFIQEFSGQGCQAPMLLLTGRGSYEVDVEAMRAGAADYLSKQDLNAALLERSIRFAIERKRSQTSLSEAYARLEKVNLELEDRNQMLSGLFGHAPAGLVLFEADEPFRVRMHNEIYQAFFPEPFRSQGMVGLGLQEYVPTADADGILTVFREVASIGQAKTIYDFAFSGLPDGTSWWNWHLNPIISGGKVTGLVHMAVNVTEQHLAERALQESESHYRLLFETMLQGVVYQDADGKIIAMNPAAERILGIHPKDFLGQTSKDRENLTIREDGSLFPGEEHPAIVSLRTGQEVRGMTMGVYNPVEKQYRWIKISAVPLIRPGETRPYQVYTLFDDVTEQRMLEAKEADYALQMEVQRRLMEQREMERLDLARDLHDGPLQELTAISFTLADAVSIDQKDERIARLTSAQNLLLRQASEIRQFCNELRPPALAPFGLEKAVRSHIEAFQSRHPNIRFHLDLTADRQALSEHTRMGLFRIYQELLNNIAKHSQASDVWIRLSLDSENGTLEVRDNGVGFHVPTDWMAQARSGHLGLIGMRERASAIHGVLDIQSRPGHGTRVRVTAPRAAPVENQLAAAYKPARSR